MLGDQSFLGINSTLEYIKLKSVNHTKWTRSMCRISIHKTITVTAFWLSHWYKENEVKETQNFFPPTFLLLCFLSFRNKSSPYNYFNFTLFWCTMSPFQVYAIGGFFVLRWAWARWNERRGKKRPSDDDPSVADD